MMDPTELNDPAKAEAFLRETIDSLAERITELEAHAEEKIQKHRERLADNPAALLDFTRAVQDDLLVLTEPLRQYRQGLVELVECAETIRKQIDDIKRTQAE